MQSSKCCSAITGAGLELPRYPYLQIALQAAYSRGSGLSHDLGFSIRISPRSSVSPDLTVNSLRIAGPVSLPTTVV